MTRFGLPHSEIPGSKDVCSFPRLIAAYHVLHRLHVPRHSPYALNNFTKVVSLRNATTSISTLSKNVLCSTWEQNSLLLKKLVEPAPDLSGNRRLSRYYMSGRSLIINLLFSLRRINYQKSFVELAGIEPTTS